MKKGFTLIELLVVISIIAILAALVGFSFINSQLRARDAARKSDLRQISRALELFYSDHNSYPDAAGGKIAGCPYNNSTSAHACEWGEDAFSDGVTLYFNKMPKDPISNQSYIYRVVPNSQNQKYQLFARLESTSDIDCLGADCQNPPVVYSCGNKACNFAITSTNTTALE